MRFPGVCRTRLQSAGGQSQLKTSVPGSVAFCPRQFDGGREAGRWQLRALRRIVDGKGISDPVPGVGSNGGGAAAVGRSVDDRPATCQIGAREPIAYDRPPARNDCAE